jgi:hypothetical protein
METKDFIQFVAVVSFCVITALVLAFIQVKEGLC